MFRSIVSFVFFFLCPHESCILSTFSFPFHSQSTSTCSPPLFRYDHLLDSTKMPRARSGRKKHPEGFAVVEEKLNEFAKKLQIAGAEDIEGKRADELLWPIMRLHHQRSRYIYQMYYEKKEITKEVYQYCLDEKYADAALIAKWKKPGYENLCCLRCTQTVATNNLKTCICRVPRNELDSDTKFECKACGCRGCA